MAVMVFILISPDAKGCVRSASAGLPVDPGTDRAGDSELRAKNTCETRLHKADAVKVW